MGQTDKIYSVFFPAVFYLFLLFFLVLISIYLTQRRIFLHMLTVNKLITFMNIKMLYHKKRKRKNGAEKEQHFNYKVDMLSFIEYFLNYKIP